MNSEKVLQYRFYSIGLHVVAVDLYVINPIFWALYCFSVILCFSLYDKSKQDVEDKKKWQQAFSDIENIAGLSRYFFYAHCFPGLHLVALYGTIPFGHLRSTQLC